MADTSSRFTFVIAWPAVLADLGVSQDELLKRAGLPLDLFDQKMPSVSAEEYFRFWTELENLADDPAFALRLGSSVPPEAFSAAILVCLCSPDMNHAMTRLAQYKPLVGPMRLDVQIDETQTVIAIKGFERGPKPPSIFMATDLVFLTLIARRGTRQGLKPLAVTIGAPLAARAQYEDYFGAPVMIGDAYSLTFSAEDARQPFLTENDGIWTSFEPELTRRLDALHDKVAFRKRVQKCLMETVAGGKCDVSDVAARLGVSVRTLQRRLSDEGTSFKQELNALRERLARHYLDTTLLSNAEVAFLLGYEDPNSFIRAFHNWTGRPPEKYRAVAE